MKWTESDLGEALSLFKQKMILYLEDEEITDARKQARKICRGIGDEGLRRLNASGLSDDQKATPDNLWNFFENQLKISVNFRIHRLHLMQYRQKTGESLDDFVTRARTLALKCQFSDDELNERIIELIIASTPHDAFRNDLYSKEKGFPIADILKEGRKYEALCAGNEQLQQLSINQNQIHSITRGRKCGNCDTNHKPRQCPAYHDECLACGLKGHWAKCCRKTKKKPHYKNQGRQPRSKSRQRSDKYNNKQEQKKRPYKKHYDTRNNAHIDSINNKDDSDSENDSYQKHFYSITISSKCMDSINVKPTRDEAYTTLKIKPPQLQGHGHTLRLKIDSGASGNTLPLRTFQQMYGNSASTLKNLQPASHIKLTSYSGDEIICLGIINIPCQHKESNWVNTKFYVVDVPGPAVVGLPTSESLGLITINVDTVSDTNSSNKTEHQVEPPYKTSSSISNIDQLKSEYPNQFDKIGNFSGKAQLILKPDAEPFIDAPRKCSIHIKEKLRNEIDNLIEQGVLRKVEEHTDWCSSMAFSTKKDGSLRICIDPQKLNASLKRCPHKIPTVEELNPQFAKAKVFSKLDAKAGYWSVHLDEASQLLTTCRTPFGRVCWRRLPFGLSVSQDIYQAKMDQILEGLDGVVSIADDVVVYGEDDDAHDRNLHKLMKRAENTGLVFNSNKCAIKQSSVSFFGNIYTTEGIKPDPAKINDIQKMPTPQNKDDLHRFMGMLNYLSQYIPKFAEKAHTLRSLLKSETPWTWHADHQECFNNLKSLITTDTCLKYYDPMIPLSLEVDASQKGLGAALVQDGYPVAFGSKTLTDCQSRYSNIEREMLAIVYGIQRYHTYLYGKSFTVITDHKPLVTICNKPLHSAPPRLQRMLVKIQGYNHQVVYRPGNEMIIADTLSRLPNPENNSQIELDERIDGIDAEIDDPSHQTIAIINFSLEKQQLLRSETTNDQTLNALKEVIYHGWPERVKDLPANLRSYWTFRDELAMEAGVIFKGRQILIPLSMQEEILNQLHMGHQGVEKTRRLARESVYWININKDIEKICTSCSVCQEHQDANIKEPLEPHKNPSRPWQYISSDLFEVNNCHYLLTVDRYSKYPLVDQMPTTVTSTAVANNIKKYISLFGRPDEIMTDNGPQYTGQAFKQLLADWNIKHVTSSPHYARSNGFIERHVRHIKSVVKKCTQQGDDLNMALLNIRATPIDSKLPSPAEMMFGRPISTILPSHTEPGQLEHRQHLEERSSKMKNQHDLNSRKDDLPPLFAGQNVRVLNTQKKTWHPGIVVSKCTEPRCYIVETPNGNRIRRNRSHLRNMNIPIAQKRVRFDLQPDTTPAIDQPNQDNNATQTTTNNVENTQQSSATEQQTRTRSGRAVIKPARYENFI